MLLFLFSTVNLYLDDLFLSLSQQTLQDFEIIAIDDASSDQSFTIIYKNGKENLLIK